jgi:hypothetical protein
VCYYFLFFFSNIIIYCNTIFILTGQIFIFSVTYTYTYTSRLFIFIAKSFIRYYMKLNSRINTTNKQTYLLLLLKLTLFFHYTQIKFKFIFLSYINISFHIIFSFFSFSLFLINNIHYFITTKFNKHQNTFLTITIHISIQIIFTLFFSFLFFNIIKFIHSFIQSFTHYSLISEQIKSNHSMEKKSNVKKKKFQYFLILIHFKNCICCY